MDPLVFNLSTYFLISSVNHLSFFCISTAVSGGQCSWWADPLVFNLLTYFLISSVNYLSFFCISTAVSGGRCNAVVGRPISLQWSAMASSPTRPTRTRAIISMREQVRSSYLLIHFFVIWYIIHHLSINSLNLNGLQTRKRIPSPTAIISMREQQVYSIYSRIIEA